MIPPVEEPVEHHVLYRVFGHDEALLYVGRTLAPIQRFTTHQREKDWWRNVAVITLQHFEGLDAVVAAECQAIRDEHPVHNVLHSQRPAAAELIDLSVVGDDQCSPLIHPRLEPSIRVRLDAYCQRERRSITNAVNKLLDDALTAAEASEEKS